MIAHTGPLNWGILGTGRIAGTFAKALSVSTTGALKAVGSRGQASADAFGAAWPGIRCHGSYDALLNDPDIDTVYIATPHPTHAEWAIRAAEAGKHILCEKPLTLNQAEAMAVIEAARRHDVFLMEAFMYRCHPQTVRLRDLIWQKAIGDIKLIQATHSYNTPYAPGERHFANSLGGGGILDLGCYCVSLARLVAGVAMQREFADPIEVYGTGVLSPTGVDELACGLLKFPGDICAQLNCGLRLTQDNEVRLYGTEGFIRIPKPWNPGDDVSKIEVRRYDEKEPRNILVKSDRPLFTLEADTVASFVRSRQAPAMKWDDTLGNMRTLDRWREALGVVYDSEKPDRMARPVHGRPLSLRKGAFIPRRRLPGLDKDVSQLVLGTMHLTQAPLAFSLFDDYIERGGNAFDCAYVYGGGQSERLLGHWMTQRQIRDKVVVVTKGAHTPYCTPEWMTRQLVESLERLQTPYVDIYMLHRDDIEVPVGEFIEVLNEHQRAGRICIFGASNWNTTRIDAANAYARSRGLNGFEVISNQFSLARMIEPPWDGSVSASDPKSRAFLARTGIPLLPWSSQAGGFFSRGDSDDRSDLELVRCWYSDDNFKRLSRAKALANRHGVTAVQIALAYTLNQSHPILPMIGPLNLPELRSSCEAVLIRLSPQELAWLNLESESL
jgi:predicted dehydrogenase/aryl-alcohol dehydrogenase-like predicted oxidoreductase